MIRILMENIQAFGLPLDTTEKITKMGESKRILKRLEKKYGVHSWAACRKWNGKYMFFCNAAYAYIPEEVIEYWIKEYENYVRASLKYKMLIAVHMLRKFFSHR